MAGLGAALLGAMAGCSYWYTVDDSQDGPSVVLSLEEPARDFTLRACVDGAQAEDMAVTVIARAQMREPQLESPAQLALTLAAPGDWENPSQSTSEVAPTGTTSVVQGVSVGLEGLSAVCEQGVVVSLERLDPDLVGRVEIEWTAYVSAGSPSADIEAADLTLEVD